METRDNGAVNSSLYLSVEELELIERDQRFDELLEVVNQTIAPKVLWRGSKPWLGMARLWLRLSDGQQAALVDELRGVPFHLGSLVDVANDLSTSPAVKQQRAFQHPVFDQLPDFSAGSDLTDPA